MTSSLEHDFKRLGPWFTKFEINGTAYGGQYDALNDGRVDWFFQHLPHPRTILELGSLEGGHTLALSRRPGVERVLGLEGRPENFKRAQFVQQTFDARTISFELANLESADLTAYGRFDAVFCVGLLYHLLRPWELVDQIARVSDRLYLWTHYAPQDKATHSQNGLRGMLYKEFGLKDMLSGMSPKSFWPNHESLLSMLHQAGFKQITTVEHNSAHPHGPGITLVASKARA